MERRSSGSIPPAAAREQLRSARRAQAASVRRASVPAWCILALSVFCGVQAVAPADRGPGNLVSIIAIAWLLVALVSMSARHQWRPLRSWPKSRWGLSEVTLIWVAVLVGGVIGPHVLADHTHAAVVSWGLGGVVAVIVGACLLAAYASYRRRSCGRWPQ